MTDYKLSIKQFEKKGIKPKLGDKVLFASFSDSGIGYVEVKKISKDGVIVTPCEPPNFTKK